MLSTISGSLPVSSDRVSPSSLEDGSRHLLEAGGDLEMVPYQQTPTAAGISPIAEIHQDIWLP